VDSNKILTHQNLIIENLFIENKHSQIVELVKTNPKILVSNMRNKYFYAISLIKLGSNAEAFECCRKILSRKKIEAEYLPVKYHYASLAKKLNKLGLAKKHFLELFKFRAWLPISISSGILFHLGELYFLEKNIGKATEFLNECLNITPSHIKANELLSKIISESK